MRCLMKAWPDFDSTATPPLRLDHFDGVPGQARIVHHFAAGLAAQQHRGQQADDVVALDEAAVLIEQEAAVEVAVPGDAEIRAVRGGSPRWWARDSPRAWGWGCRSGKCPSGSVVHLDELERQMRLQLVDDEARAAVAGIDHDLEGLELADVDIGQQMRDVGLRRYRCDGASPVRGGVGKLAAARQSRECPCRPLSPLIGFDCSRTNFMPL